MRNHFKPLSTTTIKCRLRSTYALYTLNQQWQALLSFNLRRFSSQQLEASLRTSSSIPQMSVWRSKSKLQTTTTTASIQSTDLLNPTQRLRLMCNALLVFISIFLVNEKLMQKFYRKDRLKKICSKSSSLPCRWTQLTRRKCSRMALCPASLSSCRCLLNKKLCLRSISEMLR